MPILLDDADMFAPVVINQTPKFFDKNLTGSGKSTGLLNARVHPGRYQMGHNQNTHVTDAFRVKTKETSAQITTHVIPLAPMLKASIEQNTNYITHKMPPPEDLFEITAAANNLYFDAFLGLTPQGIIIREDASGDTITRESHILYRMELYLVPKGSSPSRTNVVDYIHTPVGLNEGVVIMKWSYAPLDDAREFITHNTQSLTPTGNSVYIDDDELVEWMTAYDVHDRICRLANEWSSDEIAELVNTHITEIFKNGTPGPDVLNQLAGQLRYLETYQIPLEAYRSIHETITNISPEDIATQLSKQNLNLLMSHTLSELDDLRDQLPTTPDSGYTSTLPSYLSTQQRNAITASEPLILVQAGAGTGKSTTILKRIQHLADCGIDPKEITVLSFTNAAADNIKAKNPDVTSMTIATMIHEIYSLNHPTHELSSIETILNSIEIYYPVNDIAAVFRRKLMDTKRNHPGATTSLNAFIEMYQDQVIEILDTIRQTCLELEIILAYQQIESMVEPPHISSKYLIIDEVQDNSIFEFIYSLKYVAKHKENLYIVGDASQTLYEFRASNPKALNALEASGVFKTFPLTTNYRSNQAILDFANRYMLRTIEANQFAQIQLRANSLAATTAKEFTNRVKLDYRWERNYTAFRQNLAAYIHNVVGPYIKDCLARNEQVAFLAYSRNFAKIIQEELMRMFPGQDIANLISERAFATTVFSEFIKKHWDEVRQVPNLSTAGFAIAQGIRNHMQGLVRGDVKKAEPHILRMVSDWWIENNETIGVWVQLYNAGAITANEFFDDLRENVLNFEVRHNAIRQSMLNQRNKLHKEENQNTDAKLIVSTIHGAKGLEFDNVVVIHKYASLMGEEEKRMYYVALTRAIKTEFILAYGITKNTKIEADYELVIQDLLTKERINALRDQGYDLALMSEDDVEAALAMCAKWAEDALANGNEDEANKLYPSNISYSTRGPELPKPQEDDSPKNSSNVNTNSAFTV